MIKIASVEDERNVQLEIERYIKMGIKNDSEIEVDLYRSAEEYLLSGKKYDLVITDIELPGINGLVLGKKIMENNPKIYLIFLTSYAEFASESYIMEAYQYILKQDMKHRLPILIEKIIGEIKKSCKEYRWVGNNQDKQKIYYKDIVYIQKVKGSKYAEYIMINEKFIERLSLNQILDEIHNEMFILVDRGHAVNVNHIKRVRGNIIYMDQGDEIAVSRIQSAQVKEKITKYWSSLK